MVQRSTILYNSFVDAISETSPPTDISLKLRQALKQQLAVIHQRIEAKKIAKLALAEVRQLLAKEKEENEPELQISDRLMERIATRLEEEEEKMKGDEMEKSLEKLEKEKTQNDRKKEKRNEERSKREKRSQKRPEKVEEKNKPGKEKRKKITIKRSNTRSIK